MELVVTKRENASILTSPKSVIIGLHEKCQTSIEISTSETYEQHLGNSFVFANDLGAWNQALLDLPESALIKIACGEFLTAILNLCQGQYRNAFKGLRLVLELSLQSVYLSANLVNREEWLNGEEHTIWAQLTNELTGPLSPRFCKAFFPEILEHTSHFRELSKTLYTELSECIHGNIPNQIPLPTNFSFSEDSFLMWHSKVETLKLIIHFAFTMRYLRRMPNEHKNKISSMITEQLGHIAAIRDECSKD